MEVNFELYKVFYKVAKEGQISAAAKKLFISQPAVSQSIKQLEEKLGGKVFFCLKVLFRYPQSTNCSNPSLYFSSPDTA